MTATAEHGLEVMTVGPDLTNDFDRFRERTGIFWILGDDAAIL